MEALTASFKPGTDPDEVARERTLAGYRSPAPNNWISDHLAEDRRMRGAVYVAIKVLMDQAASAELRAYRWHEDARLGGDQDAREPLPRSHDMAKVMLFPNRRESGAYLRRKIVQQLSLTGTSLLWRVDDGLGMPIETWSVPTGTYQPVPVSSRYPDGAYRIMPYYPGPLALTPGAWTAGGVVVDANHMVAIRQPHPLVQAEGLSPLAACDLALDTIESIDQARLSQTRQGANPSAVAEMDPTVQFPDGPGLIRLQQELLQLVGGPNRAGKIITLSPGVSLKPWSEGKVEVGWIDSWSQLVGFVMSVFGVAKSLAFMQEDVSYAVLFAALKQFNLFTLCPLLDMITDAMNMQLVWPFWGPDYCLELVPKKVDDDTVVEAQLTNDLKAGIRLVNEIRVLRGLEKTTEEWGEERAYAGGDPQAKLDAQKETAAAKTDTAAVRDTAAEKERPQNEQGAGSLGERVAPMSQGKRWGGRLKGYYAAAVNGYHKGKGGTPSPLPPPEPQPLSDAELYRQVRRNLEGVW